MPQNILIERQTVPQKVTKDSTNSNGIFSLYFVTSHCRRSSGINFYAKYIMFRSYDDYQEIIIILKLSEKYERF